MAMIAAELLAAAGGKAAAGVIASEAATGAAAVEAGSFASRSGAFLGRNGTKFAASNAGQTLDQNYKAGGTWDRKDDESADSGAGAGGSATAPVASATTEDTVDYSGT